jgi:K+/H+ antiporter YhaU regulatory subunit KhtT
MMVFESHKTPNTKKMKTTEKEAVSKIRAALDLKRLDPRRLFIVDDGDCKWIGDRAELTAKQARDLSDILNCSTKDYNDHCSALTNISATKATGIVKNWEDLPEDWRDGSALGPILPL